MKRVPVIVTLAPDAPLVGVKLVIVGAPDYLKQHGTPKVPQDLLQHECITFRSQTNGSLYAWELERGRKTWRVQSITMGVAPTFKSLSNDKANSA